MINRELTKKEKEDYRAYFKDYKLPSGKLDNNIIFDITTGYRAIFRNETEMPAINLMPECIESEDATSCYAIILLKCIQNGKPYSYPKELVEEWKRLEELGYPYD